jgi:hypothetical protein
MREFGSLGIAGRGSRWRIKPDDYFLFTLVGGEIAS